MSIAQVQKKLTLCLFTWKEKEKVDFLFLPCSWALALLTNDSNIFALQVLHEGGGAPLSCHLTFSKPANNKLSCVVQSEKLTNSRGCYTPEEK